MTFGRSVLLLLQKSVKLLDEQPNVCPCGPLATAACSHCMNAHHQFQVTKLWELRFVGVLDRRRAALSLCQKP